MPWRQWWTLRSNWLARTRYNHKTDGLRKGYPRIFMRGLTTDLTSGKQVIELLSTAQVQQATSTGEISRKGDYVPINGLKVLGVESFVLCATFVVAFLCSRFLQRSLGQPRLAFVDPRKQSSVSLYCSRTVLCFI